MAQANELSVELSAHVPTVTSNVNAAAGEAGPGAARNKAVKVRGVLPSNASPHLGFAA